MLKEQEAARLERENVELQEQATLAKIEEWDNVQAMMDADYELCKRLQEQEQGLNLTYLREKTWLGLSNYIMLKSKSYDEIQEMFDKEIKRVNTFVDMNSEVVKGNEARTKESSKRAGHDLNLIMSKETEIDENIFCPDERIKELELRTQQRNNFEEELFKDKFPTEEELAYHKELLGEPQPPFLTIEPKIRRGDPWSLNIPWLIRFSQRDDEGVFRMPQRTKELDLVSSLEKDKFEAFFVESFKIRKKEFKHVLEKRKGYYKACMNLGRSYKKIIEKRLKTQTNHISFSSLKE
ncbi:hypothetical protein Tco_0017119 [Tanacetum coccineum]